MSQLLEEEVRPLIQLSECPSVWVAEEFLTPEECEAMIALGQGRMKRSTTYDMESGEDILNEARTSSLVSIPPGCDSFVATLEERLAELSGYPAENGEGFQILNYQMGQEYRPHYDFFDPRRAGSARALAMGGQRMITILLYLHAPTSGGETIFPKVDLSVTPRQGDALIFYNTYSTGELDPQSLHASLPVIEGEKWVATKWIRERAFIPPKRS